MASTRAKTTQRHGSKRANKIQRSKTSGRFNPAVGQTITLNSHSNINGQLRTIGFSTARNAQRNRNKKYSQCSARARSATSTSTKRRSEQTLHKPARKEDYTVRIPRPRKPRRTEYRNSYWNLPNPNDAGIVASFHWQAKQRTQKTSLTSNMFFRGWETQLRLTSSQVS